MYIYKTITIELKQTVNILFGKYLKDIYFLVISYLYLESIIKYQI